MLKKQSLLLLYLCLAFLKGYSMSPDSCLTVILEKDKAHINQAIETLIEKNELTTYPFVSAVLEKRLFKAGDVALTKYPKDDKYYPLFPLSETPYNGSDKIVEVIIARKDRNKLAKLSKYVNLTHIDANIRAAACTALRESDNINDIQILTKLLATEKEESVIKVAKESICIIELTQNEAHQAKALKQLNEGASIQALDYITTYIASNPSAANKESAEEIVASIKQNEKIVRFSQTIFSGLSLGSILLLVALGLSIIYGLAGVINMSHGEFMMIGAYTTFSLQQLFPLSWGDAFFWVSLPASFLVAGAFGLVIERLVIRHLYNKPMEGLLGTWGLSLILIQMCRSIFGDVTAVRAPQFLAGGIEVMDGLMLPFNRLFIIGLTVVMVAFTYIVFFKSRLGLKIRSVTQNRSMSACMGIDTKRVDSTSFFMGSGLAGVAGCAMTLIGNVVPDMGQTYIVDSFLIVVVGGVGKLAGTIISAFSVGILSKGFEFFFEAVYGKVIMLVIVIIFLQYKPKGLFPDKGRHSDD